jgi:Mad3/BUB1 homology region 1
VRTDAVRVGYSNNTHEHTHSMAPAASSSSSSSSRWETIKENAAPLERGRTVASLERLVIEDHEDDNGNNERSRRRRQREETVRYYEELVSTVSTTTSTMSTAAAAATSATATATATTSLSADDDPLVPWLGYIKFHQDAFPSATHDQFLLLERCFRSILQYSNSNSSNNALKYRNDVRFIRVCCMYADKTKEPCSTFQELYRLQIGHESAVFWNAWAYVAEKQGNFKLTEQIFDKGIRNKAQPLQYLVLRQQRFQRRMSRYWLNSIQNNDFDGGDAMEGDDHVESNNRGVLGSLSSAAVRHNDRSSSSAAAGRIGSSRTGAAAAVASSQRTFTIRGSSSGAQQPGNNGISSTTSSFAVYDDENHSNNIHHPAHVEPYNSFLNYGSDLLNDGPEFRERETEEARWKENQQEAQRWNEYGALASSTASMVAPRIIPPMTTPTSAFAIHVDEECAAEMIREEEERRRYEATQRMARDDRVVGSNNLLRDTASRSTAETLTLDPLRYIRRPEQYAKDVAAAAGRTKEKRTERRVDGVQTTDQQQQQQSMSEKKKCLCNAWKNRLLSMNGIEQSFEEARCRAGYYSVLTTTANFNTFSSKNMAAAEQQQQSNTSSYSCMDEETEESFVDEESSSIVLSESPRMVQPFSLRRLPNSTIRDRSHPPHDKHYATPHNASSASSTVDEAVAVVGTGGNVEPTINTQWALKELSMMFSSPAVNNDSVIRGNSNANDDSVNRSSILNQSVASTVCEPIAEAAVETDSPDPDSSFARLQEEEIDLNFTGGFHSFNPDDDAEPTNAKRLPSNTSFPIFQDECNGCPTVALPDPTDVECDTATFTEVQAMLRDLGVATKQATENSPSTVEEGTAGTMSFLNDLGEFGKASRTTLTAKQSSAPFQIFVDDEASDQTSDGKL